MASMRGRRMAGVLVAVSLSSVLGACGGRNVVAAPDRPAQLDEDLPVEDGEVEARDDNHLVTAWAWDAGAHYGAGAPAADGTGIAVTSGGHRVVMLDRAGKVLWVADREGVRALAPALTDDLVIAPCIDGLVAYDRSSGRLRWEQSVGEQASTPGVAGTTAVFTTRDGSMFGVDVRDGRVKWTVKLPGPSRGPAATDGTTAVATFDTGRSGGAVAVDLVSGRQRWKVDLPGGGMSAPAVTSGVVVVVGGDAMVRALAVADGSERWKAQVPGRGVLEFAPVAGDDGTVIVGHSKGMALYDARRGDLAWGVYTDDASVSGMPAGPGPQGWFALPLDDGTLMLAHVNAPVEYFGGDGRVTGVASGPGGLLVAATSGGTVGGVGALTGW